MAELMRIDNADIRVASWDDLRTFLEQERGKWSPWLDAAAPHFLASYHDRWAHIFERLDAHRNAGNAMSEVIPLVESSFSAGPLVYSDGESGQRIFGIRGRLGDEAAGAALAFHRELTSLGNIRTGNQVRGVLELFSPALIPVNETIDSLAQERRALRQTNTDIKRRFAESEAERNSQFGDANRRRAAAARRVRRIYVRRGLRMAGAAGDALSGNQSRIDDAVASFKATEAAYAEQMQLQAPVTYWKDKGDEHKEQERKLLLLVIGYFVLTIPGVILAFGLTGGWLIGITEAGGKVASPLYVVAGAGLAATTTLLLWAGRLLTRFYLSQNHLRHDANDRAVMTSTYLALTKVQAADEKDRAIILAALFRASSDGIVKDDGAPDLGVASVASKVLTGSK